MNDFLLGLLLGCVGSMPLAGPVSLVILARGIAGRYRDGMALASGAGIAEAGYCATALFGYGLLIDRLPWFRTAATLAGSAIMVAIGLYFLISRRHPPAPEPVCAPAIGRLREVAMGFTLVGVNPGILLNWFAVLAIIHSLGLEPTTALPRARFVAGVAAGIVGWFGLLLALLHRYRSHLPFHAIVLVVRTLGAVLVLTGLYTLLSRFR